ncbi:MFS transporter [Corynebacterium sp. P7202]|uniref:MDR family MFS transporter n=1 Tax=Corynebacterium pygosceleis TaxID=2800406 RepID=A0A9Q4GLW9_9CORY|nr:MDR family MFS transporter [Corynebacterium pygosceleis]MCK7638039.1 MFS transporter [Corynebacterium pygosceleis]MCX7468755.1 MDR family MFS transporter [Corynebacterium pygosceleis]
MDLPRLPLIFTALILAMLMSSLGQMIFSAALPTIVGELGGVEHMTWVITAFLLGQTISLPIFGKLGDQFGRKYLFMFAVALFMAGSALGGFAESMDVLILARAIQGVAGGGLMILSQAITADVVSARQRGKYMGIMGSVFGLASVLGPVLGGWFTDGPGWRWGLWLNIPMGAVTLLGIALFLTLPDHAQGGRLDWTGMVTMAAATTSFILTVTWGGRDHAWTSPMILGLICSAVVFTALFVVVEKRARDPLVPMWLFRNHNFRLTTVAGFIAGIFMFGALAYMPTYLQMVHSMSPTEAGLMMVPMMFGLMGTSITVGARVSRTGRYRIYPIVGMTLTGIALWLLSDLSYDSSLIRVGGYLFILGMGLGCAMQILVLVVQNSFPISVVGTATAANNFFRQIGGATGSALVGGIFVSNLSGILGDRLPGALAELGDGAAETAAKISGHGANLTPALVQTLPEPVRVAVDTAYNDALTPVFALLAPLAVVCAVVLFFVREEKLKDTIS